MNILRALSLFKQTQCPLRLMLLRPSNYVTAIQVHLRWGCFLKEFVILHRSNNNNYYNNNTLQASVVRIVGPCTSPSAEHYLIEYFLGGLQMGLPAECLHVAEDVLQMVVSKTCVCHGFATLLTNMLSATNSDELNAATALLGAAPPNSHLREYWRGKEMQVQLVVLGEWCQGMDCHKLQATLYREYHGLVLVGIVIRGKVVFMPAEATLNAGDKAYVLGSQKVSIFDYDDANPVCLYVGELWMFKLERESEDVRASCLKLASSKHKAVDLKTSEQPSCI